MPFKFQAQVTPWKLNIVSMNHSSFQGQVSEHKFIGTFKICHCIREDYWPTTVFISMQMWYLMEMIKPLCSFPKDFCI